LLAQSERQFSGTDGQSLIVDHTINLQRGGKEGNARRSS